MSIDAHELLSLPDVEKSRIVELLWDNLGESHTLIPLPDWVGHEVARRREEMRDPALGLTHEETWKRIANRHG